MTPIESPNLPEEQKDETESESEESEGPASEKSVRSSQIKKREVKARRKAKRIQKKVIMKPKAQLVKPSKAASVVVRSRCSPLWTDEETKRWIAAVRLYGQDWESVS